MKTEFKKFNEAVEDPFYNHKLRMEKGYRPKYKSGMIAIRFLDDEFLGSQDAFKDGEYPIDYQDLFSTSKKHMDSRAKKFVEFFEKKYGIKMSDYRSGTSDFYIYFNCEPGTEEQKIKEISQDKIVKDIDYVDARGVENRDELESISRDLLEVIDEYGDESTAKMNNKIKGIIKRLQNLL